MQLLNRESWLNHMTEEYIKPMFTSKGYTIPEGIKYSCSFSTKGAFKRKGQKRFVAGQCISNQDKAGNHRNFEIVIVPNEANSIEVLDTLIHELCHALHFNHSISFWKEVEKRYPSYLFAEKWLKENGRFYM
jgi:hypothetical protein